MKKLSLAVTGALMGAALLGACQQDNRNIEKKLDDLTTQVAELTKAVKAGGGARPAAAQPARPARPQPDAAKTYAVPVDGDPFEGPADAKVTIIKAYDYGC